MPDEAKHETADPVSVEKQQQSSPGYKSVVIPIHGVNLVFMGSGETRYLPDERHPTGREGVRLTDSVILTAGHSHIALGLDVSNVMAPGQGNTALGPDASNFPTGTPTHPPRAADDTMSLEEAAMSTEIDQIIARLDEGIPKLMREMGEIRTRLRRPVGV